MTNEKTTGPMRRTDVKWICNPAENGGWDESLRSGRALEGWRAEKAGEEKRISTISAGAGGIVGGVVAVIVKVLGVG